MKAMILSCKERAVTPSSVNVLQEASILPTKNKRADWLICTAGKLLRISFNLFSQHEKNYSLLNPNPTEYRPFTIGTDSVGDKKLTRYNCL